jgi:tetratricopeptide (TPR) repeat protein
MKRLILAVVGISVGVIGGTMLYLQRQQTAPVSPIQPMAEAALSRTTQDAPPVKDVALQQTEAQVSALAADSNRPPLASPVQNETKPDSSATSTPPSAFRQAIDILVSPQTTFQQRQAAWKQLRDAGELDQALASLKQGVANNPTSAEYPTALGEAYVYKLQTVRDFHEVSILALQADQSFNTALGLAPSNWEAQFFKAAALARWPAEMNKGPEVIQQFSNLIDQQEAMPPQPQFAQTYVLLGDQYKKTGQRDYAVQTWRLGLAKFPGDSTLQGRIAHP